jgi:hypothetical protein
LITFLKLKILCDIVDLVDLVDLVDILKTSEKELRKHLFFLFKVYYSPMLDYCRERENK